MTTFRALMLGTAAAGLAAATFAAPAVAGDRIAASGNDKVKLTVYGHINRSIMIADDGSETNVFFSDNAGSQSRFGFKGTGKISEDMTAGAHFELGASSNLSSRLDQTDEGAADSSDFINERLAYVYFDSKKFGKLSLGQLNTATNGAAEVDLSGSAYLGTYNDTQSAFGNHFFVIEGQENPGTNTSARGPNVGSVFGSFDGQSRDDGVRYDTPKFAGFQVSGSAQQGGEYSIAGRYSGEFGGFKIAAAAGYDNISATQASTGYEYDITGSASVIHSSGISLTLAAAKAEYKAASTRADDPSNLYVKLGYKASLTDLGATAFAVDWQQTSDLANDNQDAQNFGFGVVQYIDSAATQLYANLKFMDLDDNGTTSYEDMTVAVIGARVKF